MVHLVDLLRDGPAWVPCLEKERIHVARCEPRAALGNPFTNYRGTLSEWGSLSALRQAFGYPPTMCLLLAFNIFDAWEIGPNRNITNILLSPTSGLGQGIIRLVRFTKTVRLMYMQPA